MLWTRLSVPPISFFFFGVFLLPILLCPLRRLLSVARTRKKRGCTRDETKRAGRIVTCSVSSSLSWSHHHSFLPLATPRFSLPLPFALLLRKRRGLVRVTAERDRTDELGPGQTAILCGHDFCQGLACHVLGQFCWRRGACLDFLVFSL